MCLLARLGAVAVSGVGTSLQSPCPAPRVLVAAQGGGSPTDLGLMRSELDHGLSCAEASAAELGGQGWPWAASFCRLCSLAVGVDDLRGPAPGFSWRRLSLAPQRPPWTLDTAS